MHKVDGTHTTDACLEWKALEKNPLLMQCAMAFMQMSYKPGICDLSGPSSYAKQSKMLFTALIDAPLVPHAFAIAYRRLILGMSPNVSSSEQDYRNE